MIDVNTEKNVKIIQAIRAFHKSGQLPVGSQDLGIALDGNNINISYGFQGKENGKIKLHRGQFEITAATNSKGEFVNLAKYNHEGFNRKQQDYINALKSNNTGANQTYISALIILTSESCRSVMVNKALFTLLKTGAAFDEQVWSGLEFAFTHYEATATCNNLNIKAGDENWHPLKFDDYIRYIESNDFKGDEDREINNIKSVVQYCTKK